MSNPTFILDGYFNNMINDIIMEAESDDVELAPIDVVNIAVYTLHSIATSGNSHFKYISNPDAITSTLNSIIGSEVGIVEFLDEMKNAIESGESEKIDATFINIGNGGVVSE